jgi:hypothetical protein
LYNFDEWTVHEYGGLGDIFGGQTYEIMEASIYMGNEVGCLIIEKIRDIYAEFYNRQDT